MCIKNEIKLEFEKTLTNLAGNRFGRKIYQDQIKDKLKSDETNIILIPDVIEDVAVSFVQGIYSEICETYGKEKALEMMELKSVNPEVLEKMSSL